MKKRMIAMALCLAMILSFAVGCGDDGELGKYKDSDVLERVDDAGKKYAENKGIVGMSVAVIKNGKVAYLNYGSMSEGGDPVDENTLYEIASITKTFVGTILALEVNEGNMSLDDPIQDYLDYEIDDTCEGETMTLVTLANHTSGLPRMPRNWRDGPNPYKNYTYEKLQKFMEDFTMTRKPGSQYEYSNLAYSLLGCAFEKVEGKGFEDIVDEKVCQPLGLNNTAIFLTEEQQAKKASPHMSGNTPGYEWDFDSMKACAGLKSSTRDLARYVAAYLGQLTCSEELTEAFDLAQEITYKGGPVIGLAWRQGTTGGKTFWEHDGLAGGYTSYVAFNEETGSGVVVLCNSADGVIPLGTSIMGILMEEDE